MYFTPFLRSWTMKISPLHAALVFPQACLLSITQLFKFDKVKVGVLRPVQQPGSYWDRSSELPLVGLEPTEVTAYD